MIKILAISLFLTKNFQNIQRTSQSKDQQHKKQPLEIHPGVVFLINFIRADQKLLNFFNQVVSCLSQICQDLFNLRLISGIIQFSREITHRASDG